MRGSPINVIARSSRRLMPPEYVAGVFLRRLGQIEAPQQFGRAPPALGSAQVAQVGHQDQVLLAGEQVVHRRELPRDADRGAHPVGIAGQDRGRRPSISPPSAAMSVERMFTTVVLPAPLGPSSAKIVPSATSRSMPSSTTCSPNDLRNPLAEIADADALMAAPSVRRSCLFPSIALLSSESSCYTPLTYLLTINYLIYYLSK